MIQIIEKFYENIDLPIKTLKLEEYAHLPLQSYTIRAEDIYQDIVKKFENRSCDSLVVLDDNTPIGIITEQDLLKKVPLGGGVSSNRSGDCRSLKEITAQDLMTADPNMMSVEDTLRSSMELMGLRKFRHLPIVNENGEYEFTLDLKSLFHFIIPIFSDYINDDQKIVGWSHVTIDEYDSILPNNFSFDEISAHLELFFKVHLKRLIYHRPLILDSSASVGDAVELLGHRSKSALLITEFETKLLGVLTERDLSKKFFVKPDLIEKAHSISITEFMTSEPHMLLSKHTLANAMSNISAFHYRNIIIVDEDKQPLSIIELMDIFKFLLFHLLNQGS